MDGCERDVRFSRSPNTARGIHTQSVGERSGAGVQAEREQIQAGELGAAGGGSQARDEGAGGASRPVVHAQGLELGQGQEEVRQRERVVRLRLRPRGQRAADIPDADARRRGGNCGGAWEARAGDGEGSARVEGGRVGGRASGSELRAAGFAEAAKGAPEAVSGSEPGAEAHRRRLLPPPAPAAVVPVSLLFCFCFCCWGSDLIGPPFLPIRIQRS